MTIFIKESLLLHSLKDLTNLIIDYQTNAIHGYLGNKDIILFKFDKFGFIHDNRYTTYTAVKHNLGILITIETKI